MSQQTQDMSAQPHITHEYILVVKRSLLFSKTPAWQGLNTTVFQEFSDLTQKHKEFVLRAPAETDLSYKQIIPYLIFTFDKKLFVMERKKEASEQRLASKLSLGIGGHIRQEDMQTEDIIDWGKREFEEEVSYQGSLKFEPLGVLNDDANDVGKVHIGFVYLVQGDNANIAIKDEHKGGKMMSLEECEAVFDRFESWSKQAFTAIKEKLQ